MIKYVLIFTVLFISTFTSFGQVSPFYEKVIPPSPETASIAKYGNTPISYNTGTPNIAVPIYTIKGKQLELPISLTYDAKGHKVDEVASWVGLGWTLNAGGVIARSVRGKPDESSSGYFNQRGLWETYQDPQYDYDPGTDYLNNRRYQMEEALSLGELGLIPDAFTFNFGEYAGTITFKYIKDGSNFEFYPIISPFQDLKIEPPFGKANDFGLWKITTPDGTQYTFDAREKTSIGNYSYASAWYLSEIRSADGRERITFTYVDNPSYSTDYSGVQKLSTQVLIKSGNTTDECIYPASSSNQSELTTVYTKRLDHISFSQSQNPNAIEMYFASSERLSCEQYANFTSPNLYRLNGISVLFKESDNTYRSFKNYSFKYTYYGFSEPTDGSTPIVINCNSKNRLKLLSVQEEGKPAYEFEYDGNYLPEFGYMTDHWGYWNGGLAPGNGSFVPKLPAQYDGYYDNDELCTADRESRGSYSTYGLIKKITYPTGGYTLFEFETHKGTTQGFGENYPITKTVQVKAFGDESRHGTMNTNELMFRNMWADGDTQLDKGLPNVRMGVFTLEHSQNITIYTTTEGGTPVVPTEARLYAWPIADHHNSIGFSSGLQKSLPAGTYALVAMVAERQDPIMVEAHVSYQSTASDYYTEERIYGGARIKKITDYSPQDPDHPVTRQFLYHKNYIHYLKTGSSDIGPSPISGEGSGSTTEELPKSSLKVHYIPQYFSNDNICGNKLIVSAYSSNPFGLVNGHHVGYSEVQVVTTGSQDLTQNGIAVYKFNNSPNPNNRSKMKEESYYDSELNLLKKIKYDYEYMDGYSEYSTGKNIKITHVQVIICINNQCQFYYHYSDQLNKTNYNYGSSWMPLVKKIESNYTPSGIEYKTETSYEYFTDKYNLKNQVHYNYLTKESTTTLNGTIENNFIYAPQVQGAVYTDMVANYNYLNPVITYQQHVTGDNTSQTISGRKYDYIKIGGDYYPAKEYQLDHLTGQYELTREFSHNSDGNLISINNIRTGIQTAYMWDSRGVNLIAAVDNAVYNEVDYCSFEEFTRSGWSIGNTVEDPTAASGHKVKHLSSGPVNFAGGLRSGTYTVSLYAKGGSITINGIQQTASSEWSLLTWEVSNSPLTISGTAIIDEVRILPARDHVIFNTLTHEDFIGISSKSDPNGISTHFRYDEQQRLDHIKDNDKNILLKYEYGYYTD